MTSQQKPILYGIGNFVCSDIQEPPSEELYGSNAMRRLLERSFDHPERATDDEISRSVLHRITSLSNASAIAFSTACENGYLIGIVVPKTSKH
jgi:hypothetical protein